jgi:hypothetical protein
MTTRGQLNSVLEEELAGLTAHDAPPERVERVRRRCLSALAHRRSRAESRRQVAAIWRGRLGVAMATGLAVLYLAGAVERALEILR